MVIARGSIPAVSLPREVVACDPLGGDVIVQGMGLEQAMTYFSERRRLQESTEEQAGASLLPLLLSLCVLADDELPVYSQAEWSAWCGRNMVAAFELFKVASRLSGTDAGDQKKD